MNLCGTCRHWGERPENPPKPGEFRKCQGIYVDSYPVPENKVAIDVTEGTWYGTLKTTEDFGCVLHEPKE